MNIVNALLPEKFLKKNDKKIEKEKVKKEKVKNDKDFICMNNEKLFKSQNNINHLIPNIMKLYQEKGLIGDLNKIRKNLDSIQTYFIKKLDFEVPLSEYNYNAMEILDYTNTKFLYWFEDMLNSNDIYKPDNIRHQYVNLMSGDNKYVKKTEDLLPQDIHVMDVWHNETQYSSDNNYRYYNQIPAWQRTTQIRHYDRSNEGLQSSSDRASLENPIYKYNMDDIYKTMDNK